MARAEGDHEPAARRFDARFLLPALPGTALLLGHYQRWAAGLNGTGVQLRSAEQPGVPDVVFAPAALAGAARRVGAPNVILSGGNGPGAEVIAFPDVVAPRVLVPLSNRRAAGYALGTFSLPGNRLGRLRQAAARAAVGVGVRPPPLPHFRVFSATPGPPALLAACAELLDAAAPGEWFYAAEGGADSKRSLFFQFARGSAVPQTVAKFLRLPEQQASFRREEAGLRAAASAEPTISQRAPRLLGCVEAGAHHVCLQTAVYGVKLELLLAAPGGRRAKTALISAVAEWLIELARRSQVPPGDSTGQRRPDQAALAGELGETVAEVLRRVPTVFQHGDLSTGNVIFNGTRFALVDWEWATPAGQPLWDLLHFGLHALPALDGRDWGSRAVRELFAGQAPASALLFGWIRRAARDLMIDDEDVARLALLGWARHARLSEQVRREAGGRLARLPVETAYQLWRSDPEFGDRWSAWR